MKLSEFKWIGSLVFSALVPVLFAPVAKGEVAASIPSGLVGWWKCEGNAQDIGGSNNGTLEGNVSYGTGEVGQGFVIDGYDGSGIMLGKAPALQLQNLTIEAWIKRANPTIASHTQYNNNFILGWGGGGYGFGLCHDGRLILGKTFADGIFSTATVTDTNFHHVAVSRNGSTAVFYVDGVPSAPITWGTQFTFGTTAAIGECDNVGASFWGTIDEVAVYNRELSASEIQSIYQAGGIGKVQLPSISSQPASQNLSVGQTATFTVTATGTAPLSYQWFIGSTSIPGATNATLTLSNVQLTNSGSYYVVVRNAGGNVTSSTAVLTVTVPPSTIPSGMVAWWKGDGDTSDQKGNTPGTIEGGVSYASGMVKKSFVVDGYDGSGIVLGSAPALQLQNLTVEAWIRRANPTLASHTQYNNNFILGWGAGGYAFGLCHDGRLIFAKTFADGVFSTATVTDTNYHHVAVTRTGSTVYFYIDGVASAPIDWGTQFSFGSTAAIGECDNVGASFWGGIDELAVYNRALATSEIKAIYDAGSQGKVAAPVAPTITSQPALQAVIVGQNATFNVSVSGTAPLAFQWYRNGTTRLSGATNAQLLLTNVQLSDAGTYSVVITNAGGTVSSSNALLTVSMPSAAVPSGLVGWWKGEDNALDQTGTNSGTVFGNVQYGAAEVGRGFVFDGNNGSEVLIGNQPSLQLQNFTIETWVRRSNTNLASYDTFYNVGVLFGFGDGGYALGMDNGGHYYLSKVFYDGVYGPSAIVDTNFHHLAVTKSNSIVVFYLDGVASDPVQYDRQFDFTTSAAIGGCDGVGASFLGTIDELSIYSRSLSAPEIQGIFQTGSSGKTTSALPPVITVQPASQALVVGQTAALSVTAYSSFQLSYQWYKDAVLQPGATNSVLNFNNVQLTNAGSYKVVVSSTGGNITSAVAVLTVTNVTGLPVPSGLVGWWKADGNALDQIGSNPGTLEGNVAYGPGEVGQAFVIDGSSGSGVMLGSAPALQLQNLTIEAWIRRADPYRSTKDVYNNNFILGWGNGGYAFGLCHDGRLIFAKTFADGVFSTATVTDTNYHHVAVTRTGSSVYFYIDGVASSPITWGTQFDFSTTAAIGECDNVGASFWGAIDEVSVYNRALGDYEVKAIYDAGDSGKTAAPTPPTIYYQPVSQRAVVGGSAQFTVGAAGTPPLRYEWRFNTTNTVAVGTSFSTLTLSQLQLANAGNYSVIVSNSLGKVTSSVAVLTIGTAPSITVQPQSQSVPAGKTVTLTVSASGSDPLSYQWQLLGQNIASATNSSLVISNLQQITAGNYRVVITNPFGSVTSATATVSIQTPIIQIGSVSGAGGTTVSVPIRLIATGSENAAGFNLQFNSSLLRYVDVELGRTWATIIVNTNQLASGQVGIVAALGAGQTFDAGTNELAYATFIIAPVTTSQSTVIGFASGPTIPKVVDVQANQLGATYLQGIVQITPAEFEGDVSPQGGDKRLDVADWVKVGRVVAGLDVISGPLEFQKLDCAPRSTLGNGVISVTDWVQAGRYAAGLDPVTPVGGPTAPAGLLRARSSALPSRNVVLASQPQDKLINSIKLQLSAQGDENALALNLSFDPSVLKFANANSLKSGARLILNTNHASQGVLGLAIAMPAGSTFGDGLQDLVKFDFTAASYGTNATRLAITDGPVQKELSDVNAQSLAIESTTTAIVPLPALTITQNSTNVVVSWPSSAQGFVLQSRESFGTDWADVTTQPVTSDAGTTVTLGSEQGKKFFRLVRK